MQKKTPEQEFEDMREAEIQRLRNQDLERIRKVGNDLPRYDALSLTEKLLDRGDVMKAVPLAVVDTMRDAAEVINFFLGQMQMQSPKMDGNHHYRFNGSGWPMTYLRGSDPLQATLNAMHTVRMQKEMLTEVTKDE